MLTFVLTLSLSRKDAINDKRGALLVWLIEIIFLRKLCIFVKLPLPINVIFTSCLSVMLLWYVRKWKERTVLHIKIRHWRISGDNVIAIWVSLSTNNLKRTENNTYDWDCYITNAVLIECERTGEMIHGVQLRFLLAEIARHMKL